MTNKKLKSVFAYYESFLRGKYPGTVPCQMPEDVTCMMSRLISDQTYEAHLLFVAVQGQKFVDEGRVEKAMRWLGFLQGVLWENDCYTLDELKEHSRPREGDEWSVETIVTLSPKDSTRVYLPIPPRTVEVERLLVLGDVDDVLVKGVAVGGWSQFPDEVVLPASAFSESGGYAPRFDELGAGQSFGVWLRNCSGVSRSARVVLRGRFTEGGVSAVDVADDVESIVE